jgi:glycosyltransferase involved in cell wall biosynthesis
MKVALLAPEMCSRGGIQSFMWRIAETLGVLAAEGLSECLVLSLNDDEQALRSHPFMPLGLQAWGSGRSKVALASYMLRAMRQVDVMIVGHIALAPLAYFLHKLGRIKRYYVILHGIEAWGRVSALESMAAHSVERIVTTTRYTAAEFAKHNSVPESRCIVIPLCANERPITPNSKFRIHGGFKLLCVARLDASERYKGFETVFQALAQLKSRYPEIHLNLVGDGNDRARLEKEARTVGIAEKVTFWGRLSDEELAAAYDNSDVFVMPSRMEGFGIVFLEAMRHGKPCIGGNHGGTPEVIEHGKSGFLVDYGDAEALVSHIESLQNDHVLRTSLGSMGRELIKSRFSSARFRQSYRRLIMSMKA